MTTTSIADQSARDGRPTPVAMTSHDAASTLAALEHASWALAALVHLSDTAVFASNAAQPLRGIDQGPARLLSTLGLLIERVDGYAPAPGLAALFTTVPIATRVGAITSTLRQIAAVAGIADKAAGGGWATFDDETLRAQGNASAFAGKMLATSAVENLPGLPERFRDGGKFLDIGTGIGALGAAFADAVPNATVVGIDVLDRAVKLARCLVDERGLGDRFEIRHQGVEDLDDTETFDLAWLPAPFIPEAILGRALNNIHESLKPGGWIIVGAGRLDGDDIGIAVTRWQTELAGGTPLTTAETHSLLTEAGFTNISSIPTPPGAPVLTCAQRAR